MQPCENRTVMVDRREGSIDLAAPLSLRSVPVETGEFPWDAGFAGWTQGGWGLIAFERKTVSDLINSLASGRLVSVQLPRMLGEAKMAFLLVEPVIRKSSDGGIECLSGEETGGWRKLRSGWRYDALIGYLLSLMVSVGVIPVFLAGIEASADFIAAMYRVTAVEPDRHRSSICLPKLRYLLHPDPPLVARVAAQIDGIGPSLAMRACSVFASVRDMVNAEPDQWMKIKGIGRATAEKIVRVLRSSP